MSEMGHIREDITEGDDQTQVSVCSRSQLGDSVNTEQRRPSGHHLSPQHGLPPVLSAVVDTVSETIS